MTKTNTTYLRRISIYHKWFHVSITQLQLQNVIILYSRSYLAIKIAQICGLANQCYEILCCMCM